MSAIFSRALLSSNLAFIDHEARSWRARPFHLLTLLDMLRFDAHCAVVGSRRQIALTLDATDREWVYGSRNGRSAEKPESRYVPNIAFALVYAALDDKDEAFKWLEKRFCRTVIFSIMVCCSAITRRFTR